MIGPGLPTHNFTREDILKDSPSASGVYAIFNPQKWIYVGEGKDIQARLVAHFNGDNACITKEKPTGFQFEYSPSDKRVARQDQLILQLGPACNQRLG